MCNLVYINETSVFTVITSKLNQRKLKQTRLPFANFSDELTKISVKQDKTEQMKISVFVSSFKTTVHIMLPIFLFRYAFTGITSMFCLNLNALSLSLIHRLSNAIGGP